MTTILIAEDEPDIRELIVFTLRFGGFNVVVARNGMEAVERVHEVKPDLIMLDVMMPQMTGFEACRKLKAQPETAHIPVVFLTAKGHETEIEIGMEAGAVGYLLKPFSPEALNKYLGELLAKYEKEAQPDTPTKQPGADYGV
jgi:CheY-like chemotaxis protein